MNELLDAMSAEIDRLNGDDTEVNNRLANSLFRIVYDTRLNIARAEREHCPSKLNPLDPLDNNHIP